MNDLISIIIPVYNVEQYIKKCLDSVLVQTYTNLQIILINDGSTDASGCICDEYAKKDNRIQVIHQENQGVSKARNVGLSMTKGAYIGFCDADDWIEPDMYEYLYKLLNGTHYSAVSCGVWIENQDGSTQEGYAQNEVLYLDVPEALSALHMGRETNTWLGSKLFTKEAINEITFDESLAICEDFAFECDVLENGTGMVCGTESKFHYIIRRNSATNNGYSEKYEIGVEVVRRYVDKYIQCYPSYKKEFKAKYTLEVMALLTAMIKGDCIDIRRVKEIQKILRMNVFEYILTKHIKLHLKGSAVVICVCFPLFVFVYRKTKSFS